MKIAQQTVTIFLSEEGQRVLKLAGVETAHPGVAHLYVQAEDELGIWVRTAREDGEHLLLIRWPFVLTVDLHVGGAKKIGLQP
jgi:hypothetical protein